MSYFPVPKNAFETAILARSATPDYSTLSTDAAPVATEVGAIWEHTDTGVRYRWTGTTWVVNTPLTDVTEVSSRGGRGLAVFVQDQTTGVLDLPFLRQLNTLTLAADTVINSYTINVATGHGAVADDVVELADTTTGSYFMQGIVMSTTATSITLNTPVNRVYTVGNTDVVLSTRDMNVDGSVTPVVFSVRPTFVQKGDMVRLIVNITDNSDMDFETFGGIPALTNGVVLRVNNGDGTYRNIFDFRSNGDMGTYAFDTSYFTNNGGGTRGFQARMTWGGQSRHGVVVRLRGSLGESLELLVHDDLTGLSSMRWLAQGSELQGQ